MNVKIATRPEEREAIYALRESVYVAELGNGQDSRDYLAGRDEADETAAHFYVEDGGRVVGTVRANVAADAPFREDYAARYEVDRFRPFVAEGQMAMISRFAIAPSHRASTVAIDLVQETARYLRDRGVEITFGDGALNLLTLYRAFGFRPYCEPYHQDNAGTLVPFVLIRGDLGYLRRMRSPLAALAEPDALELTDTARDLVSVFAGRSPLLSASSDGDGFWSCVSDELGTAPNCAGVLGGLPEADLRRLLARSFVMSLTRGQRLLQCGHPAWERWIMLSGDVRAGGVPVQRGGLVGGGIDLTTERHGVNAFVGDGGARLLSIDATLLRRLLQTHVGIRSQLLANLGAARGTSATASTAA